MTKFRGLRCYILRFGGLSYVEGYDNDHCLGRVCTKGILWSKADVYIMYKNVDVNGREDTAA